MNIHCMYFSKCLVGNAFKKSRKMNISKRENLVLLSVELSTIGVKILKSHTTSSITFVSVIPPITICDVVVAESAVE